MGLQFITTDDELLALINSLTPEEMHQLILSMEKPAAQTAFTQARR
jgi:hypothetical protein